MMPNYNSFAQNGNGSTASSRLFAPAPGASSPPSLSASYQLQQLQQQLMMENNNNYNYQTVNNGRGGMPSDDSGGLMNANTVPGPSSALQTRYLEQRLEHPSLMQGSRFMLGSNMSTDLSSSAGSAGSFNQSLFPSQMMAMGGASSADQTRLLRNLQQQHQQQQQHNFLQMGLGGASPSSMAALAAAHQQAKLGNQHQQYSALLGGGAGGSLGALGSLNSSDMLKTKGKSPLGGSLEPFPEKLHRLLSEVEATGRADVISWVDSGKAFVIHKPDHFFRDIVPHYFRQSRLSSFKRQLNLYGFELISDNSRGDARGGYSHPFFIRNKPELCRKMRRVNVHSSSNAKKSMLEPSKSKDEDKDVTKTQATVSGTPNHVVEA